VSASHNPPQYNGLKIVTAGVVPLSGEYGLPQIKSLAQRGAFTKALKPATMKNESVIDEWITHALSFVDVKNLKPLTVVVDAGNGMAGISWIRVIEKLPVKIIPMFFEPDGTFPNHLPDPLNEQNLTSLKKKIIEEKADLGFAMDGDADRLFVLDETACLLSGTITTALLADLIVSRRGKAPVLYNAVCGKIVPETIEKHGGIPVRVRVGHSFIKRAMKDYHAVFAGEHSGHFYFDKNFNADSSLIAGLLFLEYLSQKNVPLSQLVSEFAKYKASGEINFKVDDTNRVIDAIANRFSDAAGQDHLDGLSVWNPNFWFNLRASKTEPLLRLNLEADNDTVMKQKLQEVTGVLISLGGVKQ
jgi:phosphomannomutase